MKWLARIQVFIVGMIFLSVFTILMRLDSTSLSIIVYGILFTIATVVIVVIIALGAIGWQWVRIFKARADEATNKAAIVSTPHADYTIRNPKRHLVQLTQSPYLEWNGKDREVSNVERWAWYTQQSHSKGDIIDIEPVPLLLPPPSLPTMVRLPELLPHLKGDLSRLIIGVKLTDNGQVEPVTISIYDLFHTVVAGSSGWGKSIFMGSLLYQMATAQDATEFVLIDQQNHGLAPFRNCVRLRYPILQKPNEILSALGEVYNEAIGKRSELFQSIDADDLEDYNLRSGEYLPPIIVAVDEASALLADKDIGNVLKRQAWELRKFGVYQFLMLTSAKGTTIETDHRQQFASKVQLHASDRYQAGLLMNAKEAITFPAGRAMVELPGQALTIVQTPYIDRREVRQLLPNRDATNPLPIPTIEDKDTQFKRLISDGFSRGAACREVFGREYAGNLVGHCKRLLGEI